MKLTKKQLKQIIREEIEKAAQSKFGLRPGELKNYLDNLKEAISRFTAEDNDPRFPDNYTKQDAARGLVYTWDKIQNNIQPRDLEYASEEEREEYKRMLADPEFERLYKMARGS